MVRSTLAVAALAALPWAAAAAQLDYRNLDDERPVTTEDAYPIEQHAFEVMLPLTWEADRLEVAPEVMWGALRNGMIGLKVPLAVGDAVRPDPAVGGPRLFLLLNLNTEMPRLPALAIRADASLPWGSAAGDRAQLTLKGIATRSWGVWRLHLNGARTLGGGTGAPRLEAPARWLASLAVDRTLWRHSLLLIGEVQAAEALGGSMTDWRAGIGARWQATPTLVLDLGVFRRLSPHGPDLGLTFGLSRTLTLAGGLAGRSS